MTPFLTAEDAEKIGRETKFSVRELLVAAAGLEPATYGL